jgi:nucleoside phosphorylase
MTGITAGIRGRVEFGDVIVANPSWDGGSGKWIIQRDSPQFLAAPHQLPLSVTLRDKFRALSQDVALLARIKEQWPAGAPSSELRVRMGPLVSNASVLADRVSAERIQARHRELLGIEMEAYALFAAAEECSEPRPTAFALKSVVDFADGERNDQYQAYAAFTSAQVLRHFAQLYL